jgi:hypothetical protein
MRVAVESEWQRGWKLGAVLCARAPSEKIKELALTQI